MTLSASASLVAAPVCEQLEELKPQHLQRARSGFYHTTHNAELHVVRVTEGQRLNYNRPVGQRDKVILLIQLHVHPYRDQTAVYVVECVC